ncbi:COG0121 Predicted glutamine amidotransferase [Candidatus Nanopelagicaceae bacterium]
MCRLLAFTSLERKSFYDVVGADFDKFVALSAEHKDGWGMAHDGNILKDLKAAIDSPELNQSASNVMTDGALLHLRLASKGITINIDNNHPFTHGSTTFMHNGTIRPGNTAEQFIDEKYKGFIQGTTDSERYFYAVLSAIDKHGLVEGVRTTVNSIRAIADYTALNIMVQTPETLIAVCEFNDANKSEWSSEDHYELRFTKRGNDIVVASTGWGNGDWNHLDNHQMLIVDRSTLEYSIQPL